MSAASEAEFPIARASLMALWVESLAFGAFTVLYGIAIWILLYKERKRTSSNPNKRLFATATIMWLLAIAHLAIDVQRADQAFVVHGNTPGGSRDFFNTLSNPTLVAKDVIYITQTLLGDAFATYRLFMVWKRSWPIVVFPILLLLGAAVTGYGACVEVGLMEGLSVVFASNIAPWGKAFFIISLTTNVFATTLIAGRLLWLNRRTKTYRAAGALSYWDVVEMLVQSAAVYSATLASLMGTYLAGSNAQYICLDLLTPIIGVVFTLIIIRVGLGETVSELSGGRTRTSEFHGQTIGGTDYNLRPLAINVSVSRSQAHDHDRRSLDMFDRKADAGADIADADADLESGGSRAPSASCA
ncbi:hypothetical protein GSI_03491 [Ganoderma sinense ZZ0214-1]|uniref:Uncharacterized protein n=1 Tax=Ganoderma sinense ZZ0214-1 TaxID=1077348 RepID=A0A2G8SLU1_9APHY|nr:hypothetical protein GSI_03491 [Ganoderma sinense ZZ0214-1]